MFLTLRSRLSFKHSDSKTLYLSRQRADLRIPFRNQAISAEYIRRCRCRPSAYMNNVLEQDHRFLKRRMATSLWFRSVEGALGTIAGYEAMNMIRKGQIRWLAKGDITGQVHYIEQIFGITA